MKITIRQNILNEHLTNVIKGISGKNCSGKWLSKTESVMDASAAG